MIVVAGEALVDLIPTPAAALGVHPGGAPFNSARWLGWLGAEVEFLGAISEDVLGRRLRAGLAAAGVGERLITSTDRPTTLAIAQLDDCGAASYSFYTEGTSACELTAAHASQGILRARPRALLAGGITLVLEPAGMAVEAAMAAAHEDGALTLLDPNVRPGLITDRELYLARLRRLLADADVLKCSAEDLSWLVPELDVAGAAACMLEPPGPAAVIVTDGGSGSTVLTREGTITVPALSVRVLDTIGAGDAFNAGFLADWLRRRRVPGELADPAAVAASARFATAVAAIACQQRGAAPPAGAPQQALRELGCGLGAAAGPDPARGLDPAGGPAQAGG